MRIIKYTSQFKRDYKRECRSGRYKNLNCELLNVVNDLASDVSLSEEKRDHALIGNWNDHRDCHIHPDLILIYRKFNDCVLELVRLGSHSELSL